MLVAVESNAMPRRCVNIYSLSVARVVITLRAPSSTVPDSRPARAASRRHPALADDFVNARHFSGALPKIPCASRRLVAIHRAAAVDQHHIAIFSLCGLIVPCGSAPGRASRTSAPPCKPF